MPKGPRPPTRKAAALLALAALFAYGPSSTAFAEPDAPQESRKISRADSGENGGASSLPGPARKTDSGNGGAGRDGASKDKAARQRPAPPSKKLMLSIPRLGMKDVRVGDSPDQSYLDREGIMHLSGTGFPYQRKSNTYMAAHAIGYAGTRVPYAFRNLEDMKKGDRVFVRDASGRKYEYRVYKRMIVDPADYWVTEPVEGKKIISLQTCWPEPSFEKRLIVRAEIVRK